MSKPPRAFRLDDPQVRVSGPASPPTDWAPPPGTVSVEETEAVFDEAVVDQALETRKAELGLARRAFGWGGLLASAAGGLVLMWLVLSVEAFVTDLLARHPALGVVALALAALCVLALAVLAGREVLAILRGRQIGKLKARAETVLVSDDRKEGRAVVAELDALYAARPETARGRARLAETRDEIIDGADLVRVAERELMGPLDLEARAAVAAAARSVSIVTAVSPRAVVDLVFVAAQALRLVRRISAIYGGRPGTLGFLRLLRAVGTHLAVTGGMAVSDSIVQQVLGHGLAARLSARLGEGVLNGLLTARVGLSAIAVCRPLPFAAGEPPSLRDVAGFLLERPGSAKSAD